MSMLDSIKDVLSKTAKDAVKVSNTAVEYTKLKFKLSEAKDSIREKYAQIGEMVYKSTIGEDADTDSMEAICDEITELIKKAEEYEDALNKASNKRTCPSCGNVVSVDSVFCAKCGKMLDEE